MNHNTFYRHFDRLEQMAAEVFDESLALGIPAGLLSATGMPLNGLRVDPSDLNKAFLYARSGSEFLRRIVRASLMNAWLEVAGIEASALTQEQIIDCDIIFGGIGSAMGDPEVEFKVIRRPESIGWTMKYELDCKARIVIKISLSTIEWE